MVHELVPVAADRPLWVQLCPCPDMAGKLTPQCSRACTPSLTILPAHHSPDAPRPWGAAPLPTVMISMVFFLPGDQDLPEVHRYRAPPVRSWAISSKAAPWGGVSH